tara:strand:+ start:8880 stop:9149 length:270 start_codon:yes stop_codon:yes gene_type:complete
MDQDSPNTVHDMYTGTFVFEMRTHIFALVKTLYSYSPEYAFNIFRWLKCGFVDAPMRFLLDVDLEAMNMKRNLSQVKKSENDIDENKED